MQITLLKSKIHRATVTGANLDYEGSLTISADLAELVGLVSYEKILVANLSNGERFETYAIYGEARRGIIELNCATVHLGKIGDRLTIMSFARYTPEERYRIRRASPFWMRETKSSATKAIEDRRLRFSPGKL